MRSFPPAKIRNVVLVGHGGSGKTSLAEALLFCSGAVTRQGRVEDGTTTTDFDPEAVKRKISVSLGVAPFEWRGHKINLIDTPGYADFVGEVHAALAVADLAVFVVSAVEGVEVQTRVAWRIAAEVGVPGVADLVTEEAITYAGGQGTRGPLVEGMGPTEHEVHDALVEGIVVADD